MTAPDPSPEAIPTDYDRDPERFRPARSVLRDHAVADDIHERGALLFARKR